jgi:uncharacterized protein HemY
MLAPFFVGKEFLDRGEHHAAAGDIEQLAQMVPARGPELLKVENRTY